MKKTFLCLCLFLVLHPYMSICKGSDPSDGKYNFNEPQYIKNHKLVLNGVWLFFADTLIPPNKIQEASKTLPSRYIMVPSKKKDIEQYSYGTYYLLIYNFSGNQQLVFNTLTVYSSASFFVNGILVASVGHPGCNTEQTRPGFILRSQPFLLKNGQNYVVIHYANFYREKTGITNNIYLTSPEKKTQSTVIQIIKFAIIIGTLIFIIFNQVNFYFTRKKEYLSLLFAISSFFIALHIVFMSLYYCGDIFPTFLPRFEIMLTLWRLTYYCTVASFTLYIQRLFEKYFYKPALYFTLSYCIASALLNLLGPVKIANINFTLFMLFTIIIGFYCVSTGISALIKKEKDALLFTLGFGFFILAVTNDILHNLLIINSINLLDIGIFGMMLSQAQIINMKLNRSIHNSEKLTIHLRYINNNLEDIVKRRTEQIQEQKVEIETQRDKILLQKNQVEEQNALIIFQNHTIKQSINYAKEIQQAVLQEDTILQKHFTDSFILFKPKDNVSGDFYWAKEIELNHSPHVVICVADCTGHGVPGALLSMLGITMLNEIINDKDIHSPAQILEILRTKFKTTLNTEMERNINSDGMHITLCIINKVSKKLYYSGAFQSLYLIRDSKATRYNGTHSIIGNYMHEKAFTNTEIELKTNDRLYLFTDGFTDQISGNGEGRFMHKKLLHLLLSYNGQPLIEQQQVLLAEFENWRAGFEQIDDVLIMGIKI